MTFIILHLVANMTYADIVFNTRDSVLLKDDPALIAGKLKNGLKYYIRPTDVTVSSGIEITLVINAGYLKERPEQLHAAHIVEHIAFSSTERFNYIPDTLRKFGLKPGRDFGARTGFSSTNYNISLPSKSTAAFKKSLEIMRDRAYNALLDSATIERERYTVLNELGKPTGSKDILTKSIVPDPMFETDLSKLISSVRTVRHDAIVNFYKTWYRPENQAIIVVGNLNADSTRALIENIFGVVHPSKTPLRIKKHRTVIAKPGRWIFDSSAKSDNLVFKFIYRKPSFHLNSQAEIKKALVLELINDLLEKRFIEYARKKNLENLQASLQYTNRAFLHDADIDAIQFVVELDSVSTRENLNKQLESLFLLQEQIRRHGFTDEEIENTKTRFKDSGRVDLTNPTPVQFLGLYERHFLHGDPLLSPEFTMLLRSKLLKEVTSADISQELNSFFNIKPDIFIRIAHSYQSIIPAETDLRNILMKARQGAVRPYSRGVDGPQTFFAAELLDSIRRAKNNYSKKNIANIDISILNFNNGANVVFKRLAKGGASTNKIVLESFRRQRPMTDRDFIINQRVAAVIVSQSGFGGLTKKQIDDILRGAEIEVYPFSNSQYMGIKGECKKEDFERMLQLVYGYTQLPNFDDSIAVALTRNWHPNTTQKTSIYDSLNLLYQNKKEELSTDELTQIQKTSHTQLTETYLADFKNVAGTTFVITCPFDFAAMEPLVAQYIGSMSGHRSIQEDIRHRVPSAPSQYIAHELSGSHAFEIFSNTRSGETKVTIFVYSRPDTSTLGYIENEVVKNLLRERLFDRLRSKMAATYGVSVLGMNLSDECHRLAISFESISTDPEDMVSAVWNEIDALQTHSIPPDEVENNVAQFINSFREQNSHPVWQSYIRKQLLNGDDLEARLKIPEIAKTIDATMIKASVNRIFQRNYLKRIDIRKPLAP